MKTKINENTKVTLTFSQLKKLIKEGRFTDRANRLASTESRWSKIVKKYVPIIASYLEDLQDLDKSGWMKFWNSGERYFFERLSSYSSSRTIFGLSKVHAIGIDLTRKYICIFDYYANGKWHMRDEVSIRDLDGIINNFAMKLYSGEGEMIKMMAEKLPEYFKFIEAKMDRDEKSREDI